MTDEYPKLVLHHHEICVTDGGVALILHGSIEGKREVAAFVMNPDEAAGLAATLTTAASLAVKGGDGATVKVHSIRRV